jgi:hypothetical protein
MLTRNLIRIFVLSISGISLFSCKTEVIILPGDIKGFVKDASTSEPIQGATIKLNTTNDSTKSEADGTYLIKNVTPREYEIQASKFAFNTSSKNIEVETAKTKEINFTLSGIPMPDVSASYLDFGLDRTSLSFTISNIGQGKIIYNIISSQEWIAVSPSSGDVTDETDSIIVTINKTELSDSIYKETIRIALYVDQDIIQDTIGVYLNGIMDQDINYYKVVTIGNQTWMAENLKVGKKLDVRFDRAANNGIIEKFCYRNEDINCENYGAMYQWGEMRQYKATDAKGYAPMDGIYLLRKNG